MTDDEPSQEREEEDEGERTENHWWRWPRWGRVASVIGALVLFFPVGLYVLWRERLWSPATRWMLTVVVVVVGTVVFGRLAGFDIERALRERAIEDLWFGIVLVIGATAGAMGAIAYLRRHSPPGGFFTDGDRTAAIFGTTGTMFSVLLALVILLSVETYRSTDSHTNAEADAVLQQFQIAALFGSQDQWALQSELICYGRSVSHLEWSVMREANFSPTVDGWVRSLDTHVEQLDIRGSKSEAGFESFLSQNLQRQQERRGRLEGATGTLPEVVWPILLIGAAATVAFLIAYADRGERPVTQMFQVGLVTFVLGSSLLLISALDHPFGNIPGKIEPTKMGEALGFMEQRLGETIDADTLEHVLPCDDEGAPLTREPEQVAHPEGSTMEEIVREGEFVIGITQGLPLFGEIDPLSGDLSGFDVALAREIARELGVREDQIRFRDTLVADRMAALEQGRVDMVVLAMTITPEREQRVAFTRPYFVAGQSILVSQENRGIGSFRDLPGQRVCAVPQSTSATFVATRVPDAELELLPNFHACVNMLRSGGVAAVVTDDIVLAGFAADDESLLLVGGQITTEPYGVAFRRGDSDLVAFADDVIQEMINDGRWGKLYFEYLGGIPGVAPVERAKEAVAAAAGGTGLEP